VGSALRTNAVVMNSDMRCDGSPTLNGHRSQQGVGGAVLRRENTKMDERFPPNRQVVASV